jgi:hypothetical protein
MRKHCVAARVFFTFTFTFPFLLFFFILLFLTVKVKSTKDDFVFIAKLLLDALSFLICQELQLPEAVQDIFGLFLFVLRGFIDISGVFIGFARFINVDFLVLVLGGILSGLLCVILGLLLP